jgi:hypothetical protein
MSDLSPATRALLEAARDGMGPDAAAIARMRGKIGAAAGGAAAAGGTAIGVKLIIVGIVAVAAVGAGFYARGSSEELAPVVAHVAVPVAAPPALAPALAPAPPVRDIKIDSSLIEIEPLPAAPPPPKRAVPQPPPPVKLAVTAAPAPEIEVVKPAPPPARIGLAREVELIDRAMSSLRKRDFAGALAAAHTHAVETRGQGQMAEDAAAIEIEALCRQKVSVFDKLEAFDARWPTSAQRSRLTNTCR